MAEELEVAALASVGATSKKSGSDPDDKYHDEVCRNCDAPIVDMYCSACGQLAQNFHKPIWGLITEVAGDFLSLDGRVMKTIPSMLWRPGRVTRDYLDGKRMRFVPPFRLYLLTSFIFFLLLFAFGDSRGWFDVRMVTPDDVEAALSQEEAAELSDVRSATEEEIRAARGTTTEESASASETDEAPLAEEDHERGSLIREDGRVDRALMEERIGVDYGADEGARDFLVRMANRIVDAYENQGMFFASIQSWAPRLALGLTPSLIVLFLACYPFYRRIYIYDHVITALHLQSWFYILLCISLLFFWAGQGWITLMLFVAPPIYIYRMQRVVYNSSRIFSVLRTLFILFSLNFIIVSLIFVLAVLGVAETSSVMGALSQN